MKKFEFRLGVLHKVRQTKKEQAEQAFADVTIRLLAARERLETSKRQLADSMAEFHVTSSGKLVSIDLIRLHQCYFDRMQEEIEKQQVDIQQLERQQHACRSVLHGAMSELKVIDNLHEKNLTEFKQQVLHEEQQELDEIGMQLYLRQAR